MSPFYLCDGTRYVRFGREVDDSSKIIRDDTNTGYLGDINNLNIYRGSGIINTTQYFENTLFDWRNMSNGYLRFDEGGHLFGKNCVVIGRIDCEAGNRSVHLEDCTVDGDGDVLGVGFFNITLKRCNVFNALQCLNIGGDFLIEDSYIHHPYLPEASVEHVNPIFLAGPRVIIRRSTLWAPIPNTSEGGGVTTNLTMLTVGGPIHDVTIDEVHVRWTHGGYGASFSWNPERMYNDDPLHGVNIKVRDVVFERGPSGHNAAYGPVTSCPIHRPGFEWENIRYDDGVLIEAVY